MKGETRKGKRLTPKYRRPFKAHTWKTRRPLYHVWLELVGRDLNPWRRFVVSHSLNLHHLYLETRRMWVMEDLTV
jgi:hypothetical protein